MPVRLDRRAILRLAGAVLAALATGPAAARGDTLDGTVVFADGGAVPEGRLRIIAEDAAGTVTSEVEISSDGTAPRIGFTLQAAGTDEVVAWLERADGWVLARGAASVPAGAPLTVTLYAAMH
ncbi:hypothetical protein [Roseivivax isoporae]|uniref:Uncharacterized protein n=1 Tax=Roseivivax isoporae LMG 25204 TaxID=1449351 RepID=X7F942_9RHOB|nr:hypothetical protein [Roseivivax isoporae]ETX28579.1 hypothetical protein RISW2_05665 [Roseivivax isoporae LMG 25204]